jgi:trk system potassium uptake protein TrkA
MMKQFVIIGLDIFGKRALEELIPLEVDILIIDKDKEVIQNYKDKVASAYVADVTQIEIIEKIIPRTIDTAIIDLGDKIEASILVTHYLKQLGVREIVVKAESDQHGNILKIIGATMVIFPNKEAAKKIIPLLVSPLLLNYFPISEELIIAEVKVPTQYMGKSVLDAHLREKYQLTIIAVKNNDQYRMIMPEYIFNEGDIILVAGNETYISTFIQSPIVPKSKSILKVIKRLFTGRKS